MFYLQYLLTYLFIYSISLLIFILNLFFFLCVWGRAVHNISVTICAPRRNMSEFTQLWVATPLRECYCDIDVWWSERYALNLYLAYNHTTCLQTQCFPRSSHGWLRKRRAICSLGYLKIHWLWHCFLEVRINLLNVNGIY